MPTLSRLATRRTLGTCSMPACWEPAAVAHRPFPPYDRDMRMLGARRLLCVIKLMVKKIPVARLARPR